MLNIELKGLINEGDSHQEVDNGLGWAELRALKLIDKDTGNPIAEWFYAAACNEYYCNKNTQASGARISYFIQDKFSEEDLFNSAQVVLQSLSFSDWDEFYKIMSEKFIYED